MYFIAHVENWSEEKKDFVEDKLLFFANDYPDAAQAIVNFCGNTLERITLLEAITDNSVVVINEIAETHIRKEPMNGF